VGILRFDSVASCLWKGGLRCTCRRWLQSDINYSCGIDWPPHLAGVARTVLSGLLRSRSIDSRAAVPEYTVSQADAERDPKLTVLNVMRFAVD